MSDEVRARLPFSARFAAPEPESSISAEPFNLGSLPRQNQFAFVKFDDLDVNPYAIDFTVPIQVW